MNRSLLLSTFVVIVVLAAGSVYGQEIEGYYEKGKLTEIKDLLHGMGLDFGMDFDEQGNPIPGSGGRDLD